MGNPGTEESQRKSNDELPDHTPVSLVPDIKPFQFLSTLEVYVEIQTSCGMQLSVGTCDIGADCSFDHV